MKKCEIYVNGIFCKLVPVPICKCGQVVIFIILNVCFPLHWLPLYLSVCYLFKNKQVFTGLFTTIVYIYKSSAKRAVYIAGFIMTFFPYELWLYTYSFFSGRRRQGVFGWRASRLKMYSSWYFKKFIFNFLCSFRKHKENYKKFLCIEK